MKKKNIKNNDTTMLQKTNNDSSENKDDDSTTWDPELKVHYCVSITSRYKKSLIEMLNNLDDLKLITSATYKSHNKWQCDIQYEIILKGLDDTEKYFNNLCLKYGCQLGFSDVEKIYN